MAALAEVTRPAEATLFVERSFDAPLDLVWRAFTVPEFIRKWVLHPTGLTMSACDMDVRSGGRYRWRWRNEEDGSEFGFDGLYINVMHGHKLLDQQTIIGPDNAAMASFGMHQLTNLVIFEEMGLGTIVTTQMAFDSAAVVDVVLRTGIADGMVASYHELDRLLEERKNVEPPLPRPRSRRRGNRKARKLT